MRLTTVFLLFLACGIAYSCGPSKSARKIQEVISKKDTTAIVLVHPNQTPDSLEHLYNALSGLFAHHIEYTTFSAKIKVEYSDAQGRKPEFTANVRMKKDSIVWIDISAALGLVDIRALITPDSVKLFNRQEGTLTIRALSTLQDVADLPMDFKTLQDLMVGNPIFFDSSKITSFRQGLGSIFMLSTGDLFKNLVTLANSDYRLLHCKLDDADPTRNRTADLTYEDYVRQGSIFFPTTRSVEVSEKTRVDVELNFKQFEFNTPLTYPFPLPKRVRIER